MIRKGLGFIHNKWKILCGSNFPLLAKEICNTNSVLAIQIVLCYYSESNKEVFSRNGGTSMKNQYKFLKLFSEIKVSVVLNT